MEVQFHLFVTRSCVNVCHIISTCVHVLYGDDEHTCVVNNVEHVNGQW